MAWVWGGMRWDGAYSPPVSVQLVSFESMGVGVMIINQQLTDNLTFIFIFLFCPPPSPPNFSAIPPASKHCQGSPNNAKSQAQLDCSVTWIHRYKRGS